VKAREALRAEKIESAVELQAAANELFLQAGVISEGTRTGAPPGEWGNYIHRYLFFLP